MTAPSPADITAELLKGLDDPTRPEMRAQLEASFGGDIEAGYSVAVAVFVDGRPEQNKHLGSVDDAVAWLTAHDDQGHDVYFTPGALFGAGHRSRKTVDIACVTGFGVDLDWANAGHTDTELPPRDEVLGGLEALPDDNFPTWVIDTGGGVHAFWGFDQPITVETARPLLRRFKAWGRDVLPGFDACDLNRLLRPVGTTRRKNGTSHTVTGLHIRPDIVHDLEELDRWLPVVRNDTKPTTVVGEDRPIDKYNNERFATEVEHLLGAGWTEVPGNRLRRPGDPASASSATILNDPSYAFPVLYVHSTSADLPAERRSTAADLLAHRLRIDPNDTRALARACAQELDPHRDARPDGQHHPQHGKDFEGSNSSDLGRSNGSVDFDPYEPRRYRTLTGQALLDAANAPPPGPPDVAVIDGIGLLYGGSVSEVHAPTGIGKSVLADAAIAAELKAGHSALILDLENHRSVLFERLRLMGVTDEQLSRLILVDNPDGLIDADGMQELTREATAAGTRLTVLDGWERFREANFPDVRDSNDAALKVHSLLSPCADAGLAVFATDHVTMAAANGAGVVKDPIGAAQKRAQVSGVAIFLDEIRPLGRGRDGLLRLTITKDRIGHVGVGTRYLFRVDSRDPSSTDVYLELADNTRATDDGDGDRLKAHHREVLNAIITKGTAGSTPGGLGDYVPGSKSDRERACQELHRLGFLWREDHDPNQPTRSRPYVAIRRLGGDGELIETAWADEILGGADDDL